MIWLVLCIVLFCYDGFVFLCVESDVCKVVMFVSVYFFCFFLFMV